MMKIKCSNIAITACAFMLAVPLISADRPTASTSTTTGKKMTATTSMRNAWKPETLTGKITSVDPDRNLMIVETKDGIPFDMLVTPNTRIKSGDRGLDLKDLRQDVNKNVSVRFTPERRGDVASSIQVNG